MQWSYDLLEKAEQALFDRLSVFAGRFSREAALAIGAGTNGVLPSAELAALVDASMIVADVSGRATNYRLLPTLQDFGLFNLRERGELESVRRAHAEYLASDAEEMALPLVPIGSTKRIEHNVSVEDFRIAADWALRAAQPELAIALLVPLSQHWISGGRLTEAAHWLARVNQLDVDAPLVLWRLRMAAAMLDWLAGRNEEAEAAFRLLSVSAAQMGAAAASADALLFAGHIRWRFGDLRGARDDMAAAVEAVGRSEWRRDGLAVLELYLGNIAAAEQQVNVLAAFADRTNDPVARCSALNARGWLACYGGDLAESVEFFEQCRDIAIEEGDWHHEVNARLGLGWVFPALGLADQALEQAEAARDLSLDTGNPGKQGEAMIVMGPAQLDLGDLPGAALSVAQGLEMLRDRVRRIDHMSRGLRFAGWIALADGRGDLAVRFLTVAEAEHQRIHYVDPPADAARSGRALDEARHLVDEVAVAAVTAAAEEASFSAVLDEAVDYLNEVAEAPT